MNDPHVVYGEEGYGTTDPSSESDRVTLLDELRDDQCRLNDTLLQLRDARTSGVGEAPDSNAAPEGSITPRIWREYLRLIERLNKSVG